MDQWLIDVLTLEAIKLTQGVKDFPFPEQDAFVDDPSQFLSACTTRRAGKSTALARRFKKSMDRHPGALHRYIALTRDSAKDIMWPVLQELDEKYQWNAKFLEGSLTMLLPNQARLRLYGADMKNFIRRLRGAKSAANAIDEAQEFDPARLINLVDDILTPTMTDYEGSWLSLTGTPSPIPRGMFYEVTELDQGGYSNHKWTLYQNPYLPNAAEFVRKLKEKKKWDDRNPTYLREWQGQWVLDTDSLLIRYNEEKNDYKELPIKPWIYILGVDIGHKDADALAVVAWCETSHTIWLVEEVITREQDITALSLQIEDMMRRYDISKIVMDEGALGKKIAEEIRRRKHIPVQPADKARKMENVAFLNEWLRLSKFKARKDSQFAQDSYQLQIDHDKSTPDRCVVKKGFHSDIIDAVLYAFKESPAFTYQAPTPKPAYGSEAWAANEVSEMERAAEEYFEREAELMRMTDEQT